MSTTTSSSLSIDEEEVNFIKYFIALKHGRAAMVRVFEWGYQGGHPIKDYLLTRPGYNDQKFESDFNPDQRRKLSSSTPVDVESYDISLLYALLQMACGLAQSRNPIWNTYGQTLENHLYRLKQLRNNVIHEEQRLTEQSLDTKLFELQDLIEHTYQHAASSFGKSCQVVSQLCSELCQKFAGIKAKIREPLQPADLIQLQQLQQELQIFGDHIKCKIKQMGAQELYDQYQKLYMIDPVPWLRLGINYRPSIAFTELTIQEDEVMCDHSSQGKQARYVRCENIWQETVNNGTTPDIIILTGEAGSGKTFLLKYLIEKWSCDANAVHGLDQVDIVLYTHCEQSVICSLDQLIKQLFHNTLQESCVDIDFFRVTLLKLKTIILIDGYDKANSDSEVFLKNVLQAGGNVRVLVATHPKSKDYISQLLTSANHPLHLTLKGFTPELHSQYTDKMIDILVEDINQRASIKECISSKLKELEITLGDECNDPLTLTLLSLLWVECPQTVNTHTSMTDLSQEITNLKSHQPSVGFINHGEGHASHHLAAPVMNNITPANSWLDQSWTTLQQSSVGYASNGQHHTSQQLVAPVMDNITTVISWLRVMDNITTVISWLCQSWTSHQPTVVCTTHGHHNSHQLAVPVISKKLSVKTSGIM